MAFVSSAELLVLHGVRIMGMADSNAVSRRFSLDDDTVEELLLTTSRRLGAARRLRRHQRVGLSRSLRPIGDQLADDLTRFAGYPDRFSAALERVDHGQRNWVDGSRIDSCHTVWFELHEDLLSTLGLERGEGA
jgi:hypothetical protein